MELLDLYHQYHAQKIFLGAERHPLKLAAAKAIWEEELSKRWEIFKLAAKTAGYERIYVGGHPAWATAPKNSVFGIPATPPNVSRLLFYICDILDGANCGNGLKTVDQAQLRLPPDALESILGEHIL